ncbi:MAG: hypothetical protein AB7P07_05440 [Hyphomonadaceae bacterium]
MDLGALVARHVEARGGAVTLDAVRAMRNEAEIVEPSFTVRGPYIASVEGLMRVDIFADGACVWSEGIDRAGAWDWQQGREPRAASEAGAAALAHGVEFNLFGLHRYAERGHILSYEGVETIDGVDYYVLRIVLADGFETYRYIHPETYMIARARDVRALHPDVDATETMLESVYSDFRSVSGVISPFVWLQRDMRTGEVVQRGSVLSLEYNPPLTDADFARGRRA